MGVLQFIIFGLKTRDKDYGGAYPGYCNHCDNEAYMHAYKWRTWFHIFWVPLIPWVANKALVCPICGTTLELDRSEFKGAKNLASLAAELESGETSEEEFVEAMHEFEIEAGLVEEVEAIEDPPGLESSDHLAKEDDALHKEQEA